ncbi:hypothetical protein ACFE04_010050 [Oxalis oulophora]
MLDPAHDLLPPPSSPTISSVSSSDLDTESTGSFFHDRSTTLGTLMGVSFPTINFRAPSHHHREFLSTNSGTATVSMANIFPKKKKKNRSSVAAAAPIALLAERRWRRRRRWWQLCSDGGGKPASLGEFLEVERRFGDGAFFAGESPAGTEYDGGGGGVMNVQSTNGQRVLFADGRVLPPPTDDLSAETPSTAGLLSRFPVSLTGICSGGGG